MASRLLKIASVGKFSKIETYIQDLSKKEDADIEEDKLEAVLEGIEEEDKNSNESESEKDSDESKPEIDIVDRWLEKLEGTDCNEYDAICKSWFIAKDKT